MKTYDYINRIVIMLPLNGLRGYVDDTLPSLLCITMILRVRMIFFEITTFPNRKGTCCSRGVHIACTRTCSDQCVRKKIWPRTYIRAGSRTPNRAYVRPGLVYMAGSERRNCVVVFMGSQPAVSEWNASSCSSGGLGRNSRWKRGLAYHRTEETALCSTGHGGNGILFIGRGLAYRKTEETDLLRSKRGSS